METKPMPMRWTRTPPTVAGWWWMRSEPSEPVQVEMYEGELCIEYSGHGNYRAVVEMTHVEWSNVPIPEPADAPGEEA